LLEEWETMALSDILGRSLVENGKYLSMESDSFKNTLTLSKQEMIFITRKHEENYNGINSR